MRLLLFSRSLLLFIPVAGQQYAKCAVCNKQLRCGADGITAIKRHEMRKTHKDNIQAQKASSSKVNPFELARAQQKIDNKVKTNELKIALFLAEHNLPFTCADHLVNLIKSMDENSRVLQKISCGRTKATNLVTGTHENTKINIHLTF